MRRRELLALLALAAAAPRLGAGLDQDLAEASRAGRFRAADAGELAAAATLFRVILTDAPAPHIAAEAARLEMRWAEAGDDGWILSEAPEARFGRGFYAFRQAAPPRRVLQIPHAFKDLRTREIGLALYRAGGFDAIAWNTVPRWREVGGERSDADLAHRADGWFSAHATALAGAGGRLALIQLHGFDAARRDSPFAAIVSNGTHTPEPALSALADCLARLAGRPAAVFPRDTGLLGAITNVQARQLAGRQRFVHIEMDRALRESLATVPARLEEFAQCLRETTP